VNTADRELLADMRRERDVDVVEIAVAHEIGPADELLFGRRAEHLQRALEAEFLHRGLSGERAGDQHGAVDVVALAMAWRALDDRGRFHGSGLLRIVRVGIVFGVQRHHRLARAVGRTETRREARDAALDLETALLQQPAHQLGGLELLHAELAEVEDAVIERRDRLGVAIDEFAGQFLLGSRVLGIHSALPPCCPPGATIIAVIAGLDPRLSGS
jgi:hypothetical protein